MDLRQNRFPGHPSINTRAKKVNESLFTFTLISIEFGLFFSISVCLVCSISEINLLLEVQFFVIEFFLFCYYFLSKKIRFTFIEPPPKYNLRSILNGIVGESFEINALVNDYNNEYFTKYPLILFEPIVIYTV